MAAMMAPLIQQHVEYERGSGAALPGLRTTASATQHTIILEGQAEVHRGVLPTHLLNPSVTGLMILHIDSPHSIFTQAIKYAGDLTSRVLVGRGAEYGMLCEKCKLIHLPHGGNAINTTVEYRAPQHLCIIRHHLTFQDLIVAAEAGCEVCQLFRPIVEYAQERALSEWSDGFTKLSSDASIHFRIRTRSRRSNQQQVHSPALSVSSVDQTVEPSVQSGISRGQLWLVLKHNAEGSRENPTSGDQMYTVRLITGQFHELAEWQKCEALCIDGVAGYSTEQARELIPEFFAWNGEGHLWRWDDLISPARFPVLEFYQPREQISPKYSNVIGWRVEEDPTAPNVLALARAWLVECDQKHHACQINPDLSFPARLIDVGSSDSGRPTRLYEVNSRNNACIRYAALSHCWGVDAGNILKLKQATLADMKQGINADLLPQNFRDAIRISRDLGLQYVWIDSLCIIQDSRDDWQIEAAKMGDYYRRAEVTIAALASPAVDNGILCPRRTLKIIPRIETDQGPMFLRPLLPSAISVVDGPSGLSIRQPMAAQPLNTRAWALQERLLSRRLLYFTADQLIWQCHHHIVAEDGQFSSKLEGFEYGDAKYVIDLIYRRPQEGDHGHRPKPQTVDSTGWYVLVEKFMSRSISFDRDRLPAIAAVAREVHLLADVPYCAGLWIGDFCALAAGLLWQTDRRTSRRASNSSPSWSWSSVIGKVRFYLWENAVVEYRSGLDASLQHWSSKLASPDDTFGEVHGGRLVFEAWTSVFRGSNFKETVLDSAEIHPELPSPSVLRRRAHLVKLEEEAWIMLDVESCHGVPAALSVDKQGLILMVVCITKMSSQYCLVLERQDSDLAIPMFRRVGIALSPVAALGEEYGWTRQMLAIV